MKIALALFLAFIGFVGLGLYNESKGKSAAIAICHAQGGVFLKNSVQVGKTTSTSYVCIDAKAVIPMGVEQ